MSGYERPPTILPSTIPPSSSTPKSGTKNGRYSLMPFCERYFGIFFLLWGLILIADHFCSASRYGLFYGRLERYMEGWIWGAFMIAVGVARFIAFRFRWRSVRITLSTITVIILVMIAAIAFATGLWATTTPLSAFLAIVAFWCHKALLRDTRTGL